MAKKHGILVKEHGILVKEHMEFAVQGPVTATGALSGGLQILLLRSLSHNGASSMHKWLRGLRDVDTCILFDVSFGLDAFRL